MANPIAEQLWKLLTGKPYTTTRSMAAEFGPPPAAAYPELLDYTDEELINRDIREIMAEIRARRAALNRVREEVSR